MKAFRFLKLAALFGLIFPLTACLNNQQDDGGQTQTNDFSPYGVNQRDMRDADQRLRTVPRDQFGNRLYYPTGLHNNTRMEKSQDIADAIAAMDGVKTANVLLTDNNAYVAVVLHDSPKTERVRTRPNAGPMGGAAYRGAWTDDMSQKLKARIAEKVRALHPEVRQVYVSANPDFVQRMNNFADALRDGRPVGGLIQEFNRMVERVFPVSTGQPANTPNNIPGSNGKMNR